MSGWHRRPQTAAATQRKRDYASPEHKAERARRVAAASALTPCGYCGRPLGPNTREWHVPHDPQRNYLPGLWHGACNRTEAARRGALLANAKRKKQRIVKATPYRW